MEEYAAREARTVEAPREGGRSSRSCAYKFGWAEHVQDRCVNSRRRHASFK